MVIKHGKPCQIMIFLDSSSSFEEASLLEETPGDVKKRALEEREFLEDVPPT